MTDNSTPVPLDDITQWVTVYDKACAEIARLNEVKEAARRVVEQKLGEREVGTVAGRPVFRWAYVTSNVVDQKKLATENADLVERYKVTRTSRRFTRVES
jgi:predicted phage-related endonuclease